MKGILFFLVPILASCALASNYDWMQTFTKDVNSYLRNGEKSENLQEALDLLRFRTPYKSKSPVLDIKLMDNLQDEERGLVSCTLCRTIVDAAYSWWENGDSRDQILEKFVALCVDLGVSTPRVCRGTAETNIDVALWIIDAKNKTEFPLNPGQICGFALYPECNLNAEQFKWTLDLSSFGPKPTPQDPQLPPEGSPTLKVLHLTDVHVDPNYLPGGNAACGEPMCCRSDQGAPATEEGAAGYWGDYRDCDAPVHAFRNLLREAATRHPDVSYIMFTGDIVDHGSWDTSFQYNTDQLTLVMNEIGNHFEGVPLLPILGNHEAHPSNVFADTLHSEIPTELSTAWLYSLANDVWGRWLPNSTRDTVLRGGMYSLEATPELQIVALNSMSCLSYNWWLMYDNVDPSGQLMWLAGELKAAEDAGKKVHILAHVPGGSVDCMEMWSSQYRRIVDRFENTIRAQFHGHSHFDQFHVYYGLQDTGRATNVAFTAGSGTPFSDVNPNYRVYVVDGFYPGSSYGVLDHETWFFNLTEANLAGPDVEPNWQKLYSFNDAYGTASLFPAEMDLLMKRMGGDMPLKEQYRRFYVKDSAPSLAVPCDRSCLRALMCEILTTVVGDNSKCRDILP